MKTVIHLALAGALGVAAFSGSGSVAQAADTGRALAQAQAQAYPGEGYSQWGYGRRRYYGRRYRGGGAGVAAGVIGGLAAGALIGGAIAGSQPAPAYGYGPGVPVGNVYGRDPEAVNYCASRYRSYDPASGTFLANDGNRYACP